MRLLITGAAGLLGREAAYEAAQRGHEVIGLAHEHTLELFKCLRADITDIRSLQKIFQAAQPDAVLHGAAWTQVDAAELPENRERAYAVNALGVRNVARCCREAGARLVALSTDYVFGDGDGVLREPGDGIDPLCWYGQTKLQGEQMALAEVEDALILRTSWVYGLYGNCFPRTMLRLAKTRASLNVVEDQIGRPTYAPDLARLLIDALDRKARGVLHACGEGSVISFRDYARAIFGLAGMSVQVQGVSTEAYGAPARRPKGSALGTDALAQAGFAPLRDWREALADYLPQALREDG